MRKILFSALTLLTLLAITTTTAFAGSALELVEVRNDNGGVTFIFRVTGEFSKDELESGFVQVEGGDDYPLYCAQQDASTVVCHTSNKAGANSVVVGFGGARFWTDVPGESPQFCYGVYDYDYATESYWLYLGDYCQNSPAEYGDFIYDYYNWDFDSYYDYEFMPNSPACPFLQPGDAYYYPFCP